MDLAIRNVFTRDMRDFSVADQGKMADKKYRKCPNSEFNLEWSFQFGCSIWNDTKIYPNKKPYLI